MLTNSAQRAVTNAIIRGSGVIPTETVQKVVVVNGGPKTLALVDSALDSGRFDLVFVESNAHAYSQIKRVRPHLVILCVRLEDADGFQVLSMLKLDAETRSIPVLTYASEDEGGSAPEEGPEASGSEVFAPKPPVRMH
jgi:PleD family two-component response regulator